MLFPIHWHSVSELMYEIFKTAAGLSTSCRNAHRHVLRFPVLLCRRVSGPQTHSSHEIGTFCLQSVEQQHFEKEEISVIQLTLTCDVLHMHWDTTKQAITLFTNFKVSPSHSLHMFFIYFLSMHICIFVCVCVVQVNPTLWGQNVPTRMAISKILVRVGTFFGPHEETSL